MQYVVSVTSKGQATIPASMRHKFGIKKGGKVIFEEVDNQLVIKKLLSLEELQGSIKSEIKYDDRMADEAVEKMIGEDYIKKWNLKKNG